MLSFEQVTDRRVYSPKGSCGVVDQSLVDLLGCQGRSAHSGRLRAPSGQNLASAGRSVQTDTDTNADADTDMDTDTDYGR